MISHFKDHLYPDVPEMPTYFCPHQGAKCATAITSRITFLCHLSIGKFENNAYVVVFPVSRKFSTRLTRSQSSEIDSTWVIFWLEIDLGPKGILAARNRKIYVKLLVSGYSTDWSRSIYSPIVVNIEYSTIDG